MSSVQRLGARQGGCLHAEGAGMGAGRWQKQELVKVLHLRIWVFCPSILSLTSPAPNRHTYPPGGGSAPAGTVGHSLPFTCVPGLLPGMSLPPISLSDEDRACFQFLFQSQRLDWPCPALCQPDTLTFGNPLQVCEAHL